MPTYFSKTGDPDAIVGQTPWSARGPLDPLFAQGESVSSEPSKPTRASAADQGVRPTVLKEFDGHLLPPIPVVTGAVAPYVQPVRDFLGIHDPGEADVFVQTTVAFTGGEHQLLAAVTIMIPWVS